MVLPKKDTKKYKKKLNKKRKRSKNYEFYIKEKIIFNSFNFILLYIISFIIYNNQLDNKKSKLQDEIIQRENIQKEIDQLELDIKKEKLKELKLKNQKLEKDN